MLALIFLLLSETAHAVIECSCSTPNAGTVGSNGYTCGDGSSGSCAVDEFCYTTRKFPKGQLAYGCRKTTNPIQTVHCNFSSTDTVTGIYFNGISNTVPINNEFVFVTREELRNKIGITIRASTAAPACTQAGFAMSCWSTNTASPWHNFKTSTSSPEWQAYSTSTNTPPAASWAELGAESIGFEAPCLSTAAFLLPSGALSPQPLETPIQPVPIWAESGHQFAYFIASRPTVTHAPTFTRSPTTNPTTYVAPACGLRGMGASGKTFKNTTEASACKCEQECYITSGCEAWQYMISGPDAGQCYLKDTWDLYANAVSVAGKRLKISPSNYVLEGGYWALLHEYQDNVCGNAAKIFRKAYYQREKCYLNPDKQTTSFKITSTGIRFYNDDRCTNLYGMEQSYVTNKCIQDPHKFGKAFKMIDWSAHEVDDSMSSFLRKVYVPGYRHHRCNGPYFVEHWDASDCFAHPIHSNIWQKNWCLNNIEHKGQTYLDSSCTVVKGHEPTVRSLLDQCRQEGEQNLYYWDFGCDFQFQEYIAPHEREMMYHGEMRQCVHHPHREKTCLQP